MWILGIIIAAVIVLSIGLNIVRRLEEAFIEQSLKNMMGSIQRDLIERESSPPREQTL